MHPLRKQRLIVVAAIVLGVSLVTGLVSYALRQNINAFYMPAQIHAGEAPLNTTLRVGGLVVNGSVKRESETLGVSFRLTDNAHLITVKYQGILPDLFREGQGIIAVGKLINADTVEATEVLAKHDENYMPPEIAEQLHPNKKVESKP